MQRAPAFFSLVGSFFLVAGSVNGEKCMISAFVKLIDGPVGDWL